MDAPLGSIQILVSPLHGSNSGHRRMLGLAPAKPQAQIRAAPLQWLESLESLAGLSVPVQDTFVLCSV